MNATKSGRRRRARKPDRQVKKGLVVWGYCRVSTVRQDLDRQRAEIHEYANRRGWKIDRMLKAKMGSRKSEAERGIDKLKAAAEAGDVDVVIFSELSRLGRSVGEISRLVDALVKEGGVELHFIKEDMRLRPKPERHDMNTKVTLTMFSLLAEIERDLISERTRSGLAARKAAGVRLGRPAGKSKLDPREDEIRRLDEMGVRQKRITEQIGCTEATLSNWLKRKRPEWKANASTD